MVYRLSIDRIKVFMSFLKMIRCIQYVVLITIHARIQNFFPRFPGRGGGSSEEYVLIFSFFLGGGVNSVLCEHCMVI